MRHILPAAVSPVPDWLQIVQASAPLATLVAALIAGGLAWSALSQRRTADRRDQWWKRTQWAIDEALNSDPSTQRIGLAVLNHLTISDLCDDEDEMLVDLVARTVQDTLIDREALNAEMNSVSADQVPSMGVDPGGSVVYIPQPKGRLSLVERGGARG